MRVDEAHSSIVLCLRSNTEGCKSIFIVLDVRLSAHGKINANHIEAIRSIGRRGVRQKISRRSPDTIALLDEHGQSLRGLRRRLSRLHFNEYEGRVLRSDEVDLSGDATIIANEDAITPAAQVTGRGPLTLNAQCDVFAKRPTPPAQQAPQPFSDGCEVHAACGPFRCAGGGNRASHAAPVPVVGP